MEHDFWHKCWADNAIGFHEGRANALLTEHWGSLDLAPGSRILLPLCGKTLDIAWLLEQGHRVAGIELSEEAIRQLFLELDVQPEMRELDGMLHYRSEQLDILVGDFFAVDAVVLGQVDAIYDRAALVALPAAMRRRYAAHLVTITEAVPQLLICFEYDQACMPGPPFSIPEDELRGHYGQRYALELLGSVDVAGGLKGQCPATERAWALR